MLKLKNYPANVKNVILYLAERKKSIISIPDMFDKK